MEDNTKQTNVEFEKITLEVTASGQVIDFRHVTEIDHTCIIGIAQVFSNKEAVPDSELQLDIDGQKVFPKGYECKLLYAGDEVPPDDKFYRYINRSVNQTRITGQFTDGGALTPFVPYTANIYLMMLTNREY
jgi:hypothetical protein